MSRRLRADLLFAAAAWALCAALLALCHRFGDGLGASDGWRHIEWARLLRAPVPGALREFPVFTLLAKDQVDLWAFYHRLLIPFTFGDLQWGAKAASVFYGGLALAALAYALRRLNAQAACLVFAGALAVTPFLLARALQDRPSPLATALLTLSALCAVEDNAWAAGACAFLHAALHISWVLQGVIVLCAAGAYGLSPRTRRYGGAIAAGCALGVLAQPHPLAYLGVAFAQGSLPFRVAAAGFTDLGLELYPPTLEQLLAGSAVFLGAAWALTRLRRSGARPAGDRLFLGLSAAAFCAAALTARRFFEVAGSFSALAVCASWPPRAPEEPTWRRAVVFAAVAGALILQAGWSTATLPTPYGSAAFRGTAAALRAGVPAGEIVFNDEWRSWAKLFYEDPTHRYVVGCDPTLLLAADPARFWLWRHLTWDARACDQESLAACPTGDGTPSALAQAFARFGAGAVILSRGRDDQALRQALDSSPQLFEPLDVGADAPSVRAYVLRAAPAKL